MGRADGRRLTGPPRFAILRGMTTTAPVRFRDSAAVVLVRGEGRDLEVYWVKRSESVSYMPGFRGFLGGTVNAEDAELEIEGVDEGPERLLRACALREAFEEAGVIVGVVAPGAQDRLEESRRQLLGGETSFPTLAREHGWRFSAASLAPAGRWQTPAFAPRRFDTWYFLAHVPDGQQASVRVGELAEGEWVRPVEALERWQKGEETFAAPILYTLLTLAEGEDALVERLAKAPERAGDPIRRIEMKWGIVLHPMKTRPLPPATHTNLYLVGEKEMALIDPGGHDPEDLEALDGLLHVLAADGRKPRLILLTHHHPDHVGGLAAVVERYALPVAAHPETAKHVRVDFTLQDGDWIPLLPGVGDWNLRAIHTPGHTRGHLCFLHPRTRSLFTGDHVPGGSGTVIIDPPEGDMAAYVASLERLLEEPIETLFPGHGSPQGAAHRRIRGLLEHRLAREVGVLAALTRAPQELGALVERVYGDTPRELWGYAERSLLAHLVKLESEGRARREGEGWAAAT